MEEKKERLANIELLRIFAALGVILLHFNNANIGGGFAYVESCSPNEMLMTLVEVIFICAVNIYVLITGYFMRDSRKCDLLKPIKLLTQLIVFGVLFFTIKEIPKGTPITLENILKYFAPCYWFVFVYISLYIISPYINIVWTNLDKKGKKILLSLSFLIFSLYPFSVEMVGYFSSLNMQGLSTVGISGAQEGYTIANFILMYLIGCYIRDKDEEGINIEVTELYALLALNVAVLFAWTYMDKAITGSDIVFTAAWYYDNPAVISEAVLVFLIFKHIDIKNGKVINKLAAVAFPSYLIHINLFEYFNIPNAVVSSPWVMLLSMVFITAVIYALCFVIMLLYDLLFSRVFAFVSRHWTKKRKFSV